ncbi:VOC family protein [Phytomonospora endophytica]|uniref:Putative enzyme related to lactoylglutathione lyase n=1 Tax=Phytomonospora endophytica TaxID=714109 RepID=A0A841FDW4_9ACTN|nr:VOC family protein [Phytomonospora endophytica]MBB6033675.1 putative enzyme related to lactoylglutathione lyase [Phytomonospora endophytica]GIG64808.1 glyoxalase [Phytomonospora endophytica]
MTARIVNLTINTTDPRALADWWTKIVDGKITRDFGDFIFTDAGAIGLAFQRVDERPGGGTLLHLDLATEDLPAEVARMRELGAELVAEREAPGISWTTLRDPDGNEFCVTQSH